MRVMRTPSPGSAIGVAVETVRVAPGSPPELLLRLIVEADGGSRSSVAVRHTGTPRARERTMDALVRAAIDSGLGVVRLTGESAVGIAGSALDAVVAQIMPAPVRRDGDDPAGAVERLRSALRRGLHERSLEHPLLVVFEHADLVDAPSAREIAAVVRVLPGDATLVLSCSRCDERTLRQWGPVARLVELETAPTAPPELGAIPSTGPGSRLHQRRALIAIDELREYAYEEAVARVLGCSTAELDRSIALLESRSLVFRGRDGSKLLLSDRPSPDESIDGLAGWRAVRADDARRALELLRGFGADPRKRAAVALSTAPGRDERLIGELVSAAEFALDIGAFADAGRYLERAIVERVDDPAVRTLLDVTRLRHARLAGDPAVLEEVAHSIAVSTPAESLAVDAWIGLGDAQCARGAHDRAADAYRRATEIGDRGGSASRAYREAVARHVGYSIAQSLAPTRADDALRDAILAQDPRGDDETDRRLLAVFAVNGTLNGAPRAATRDIVERAWGDGRFAVPGFSADSITYFLTGAAQSAEEFAMARRVSERAVGDARVRGDAFAAANAAYALGASFIGLGMPVAGFRSLLEARGAAAIGWRAYRCPTDLLLARLADLRADRELLQAIAEAEGREESPVMESMRRIARGEAHLALGDARRAVVEVRLASESLGSGAEPLRMGWREPLARALAADGELDAAERLARESIRGALERDAGPLGLCDAYLAVPAARSRDTDLEAMDSIFARLPESSTERALVAERLALHASVERATGLRLMAVHIADENGFVALSRRCRERLSATGVDIPQSEADRCRSALSAAELRVAELAAEGFSNRRIATELFVTVKTVEFHLSRIYRRLGVRRDDLPQLVLR